MTRYPTPTREGFYWAKWKIADDGPRAEEFRTFLPITHWEVVDVFENSLDREEPDFLRVHVPGVEQSQSIENFFWGPGPLEPPL